MKLFVVFLAFFSSAVFGHSQWPSAISEKPYFVEQTVSINIKNLNNYKQSYEIRVNKKNIDTLKDVLPGQTRVIPVTLKGVKENTEKKICTRSIPSGQKSIRTQICTSVKFEW